MSRAAILLLLAFAACGGSGATGAVKLAGLGRHHHPVTTTSAEAQAWFDQGLNLAFAFNHDEALRSFREATRLDPRCAMCWWGQALVQGPNLNEPHRQAPGGFEAARRARELAERATPAERAYIEAVAARYASPMPADREPLDRAYAGAMRTLAHEHPEDLDAQALFAEALMDVYPFAFFELDGTPRAGTAEAQAALEAVLAADPTHPLANHLYIHLMEGSPTPEKALPAAERVADLIPGAGHIVHMPSHIYMRVGRYAEAEAQNRKALLADDVYITAAQPGGFYPMLAQHNRQVLWASLMMLGRGAEAVAEAQKLERAYRGMHEHDPLLARAMEDFAGMLVPFTLARFGRWDEIDARARVREVDQARLPLSAGVDHFAHGLAFAARGRAADAEVERAALAAIAARLDRTAPHQGRWKPVLEVAEAQLAGAVAHAAGHADDAVAALRRAAALEDQLSRSDEPPLWNWPSRQQLGTLLLALGRPKEAEAAFREDLHRWPENGWSLGGLAKALEEQGSPEAKDVAARFRKAWPRPDVVN